MGKTQTKLNLATFISIVPNTGGDVLQLRLCVPSELQHGSPGRLRLADRVQTRVRGGETHPGEQGFGKTRYRETVLSFWLCVLQVLAAQLRKHRRPASAKC